MSDVWYGLCSKDRQDIVRRGLQASYADAKLVYVESARELRTRVQESSQTVGVIVGPLDDGTSTVNIAAALVRDHMAAEVILAVTSLSEGFEARAKLAGIHRVIDLSCIEERELADLDEPSLCDDDVPTIVWGCFPGASVNANLLPSLDSNGVGPMRGAPLSGDALSEDEIQTQLVQKPFSAEPSLVRIEEGSLRGEAFGERNGHGRALVETRTPRGTHAPVVVFTSGRGGVGKTSLVAAMGIAAQRWGMRVALCDLDLWFGNLYSCFGMTGPADLGSVSQHGATEHELLSCGRDVTPNLTLWGSCAVPELAETVYPYTGTLLDAISARHDLVLVDTSVCFTDAVAQAVQQCDRLVITVDGREGSGAAQTRLAALAVRLGVARTRIVRLANRCGPRGRGEPVINRADVGLETARPLRVQEGGSEVSDCMGEGKASDLFDLGSRFADSASGALAQLLSEVGRLPDCKEAKSALERRNERPRWGFGRRREVI